MCCHCKKTSYAHGKKNIIFFFKKTQSLYQDNIYTHARTIVVKEKRGKQKTGK